MNVFKHKRRKDGKLISARFYSGRYRLEGDSKATTVALKTTDKQVAEAKLKRLVDELERERAGLLAPKAIREGLQKLFVELMAEYVGIMHAPASIGTNEHETEDGPRYRVRTWLPKRGGPRDQSGLSARVFTGL
jgi:hypothetical protein